jgi:hypothetical protein
MWVGKVDPSVDNTEGGQAEVSDNYIQWKHKPGA